MKVGDGPESACHITLAVYEAAGQGSTRHFPRSGNGNASVMPGNDSKIRRRYAVLEGDQPVGQRVAGEFGGGMKIELLHELGFVEFDGFRRDI